MQVLQPASNDAASACAAELIELMPEVMYLLRSSYRLGMRARGGVSVPQVRVLALVQRRPQGSLSELADLLGVSLPSASRLVEAMVQRKLIRRRTSARDRRHMSLMLTAAGRRQLAAARTIGVAALGKRIATLPEAQQAAAQKALHDLRQCFTHASP